MASKGLLLSDSHPDADRIRLGLEGNYCRCTGYGFIIEAVEAVAKTPCAQTCDNCPGTLQSSLVEPEGES